MIANGKVRLTVTTDEYQRSLEGSFLLPTCWCVPSSRLSTRCLKSASSCQVEELTTCFWPWCSVEQSSPSGRYNQC